MLAEPAEDIWEVREPGHPGLEHEAFVRFRNHRGLPFYCAPLFAVALRMPWSWDWLCLDCQLLEVSHRCDGRHLSGSWPSWCPAARLPGLPRWHQARDLSLGVGLLSSAPIVQRSPCLPALAWYDERGSEGPLVTSCSCQVLADNWPQDSCQA